MTLAGNVCIRNGTTLDYCWELSVQSLLGVCDEVVVCDSDSTDGTREKIDEWARREPKINVCNYPWPNPKGNPEFWLDWLNYARQHAKSEWHLQLDADELVHENSYPLIRQAAEERKSLLVKRYNFWRDTEHLIPHGKCCSHEVIRMGPQNLWLPSDWADPRGNEIMKLAVPSEVEVFHYGFLRRQDAFFRKARVIHTIWNDSYDPRLVEAEKAGGKWMENPVVCEWTNDLIPFEGTHPVIAKQWLRDRGYEPR